MNLFSKFFGESDNKDTSQSRINWKALTEINQVGHVISESFDKPVFIFKHSTRCSISRMALKQFEKEYNISSETVDAYFLDLLSYREISNEIANRLQVMHQSPQLLLAINGKCVYSVSHSDIDAIDLKKELANKSI